MLSYLFHTSKIYSNTKIRVLLSEGLSPVPADHLRYVYKVSIMSPIMDKCPGSNV